MAQLIITNKQNIQDLEKEKNKQLKNYYEAAFSEYKKSLNYFLSVIKQLDYFLAILSIGLTFFQIFSDLIFSTP